MTEIETLAGALDRVLAKAREAQTLREAGAEAVWCEVCEADTLPRDGFCLWCEKPL